MWRKANHDIMNLLQLPLQAFACNTATFKLPGLFAVMQEIAESYE